MDVVQDAAWSSTLTDVYCMAQQKSVGCMHVPLVTTPVTRQREGRDLILDHKEWSIVILHKICHVLLGSISRQRSLCNIPDDRGHHH